MITLLSFFFFYKNKVTIIYLDINNFGNKINKWHFFNEKLIVRYGVDSPEVDGHEK